MEYLLLFVQPERELDRDQDDPASEEYWSSWRAYMSDLYASGIVRGGNALKPPASATTVRVRDGRRVVHDGPFADTKELLGGYVVIEVPSLDEALDWAARAPSSETGATEIRPVLSPSR